MNESGRASIAATAHHVVPNRILASLPKAEYRRLQPDLKLVPLVYRASLHEPGEPMPYVYFPNTGVISMLTVLDSGDAIEIATVGNEGMTDLSVFLGVEESDARLLVQVAGSAMRMESRVFRQQVRRSDLLRTTLGYYAIALFALVAQSAACNRMHPITGRCARWLLMTHDRVEADTFPMTQAFLSEMLGVRRPSVSVAAATLQRAGLISYQRTSSAHSSGCCRCGRMCVLSKRPGSNARNPKCFLP